jgi:ADP-ribose pyrophosphatase YjhB (NUDIX family)
MGAGPLSDQRPADARWKPNVTVAAVIERNGRWLLVEEKSGDGRLVLNNPAGHLDAGESLLDAVVREVLEETACCFTPTHLVGVYLARSRGSYVADGTDPVTYLRFAFAGAVGEPEPGRALDDGIVRTLWLTPQQIDAERARHRSPLLARCIADHRAGRRYPLDLLHADDSLYAAWPDPRRSDTP